MDSLVGGESTLAKLRRCTKSRSLDEGRDLHAKLISTGRDQNTLLGNVIVQMYSKCGSLSEAQAAFDKIDFKNTFSWTIIISAYAQNGHSLQALQLHRKMDLEGIREDAYVISSLLAACCKLGDFERGRALHARAAASGMIACGDSVLENSLLSLYAKCGYLLDARQIFDEMARRDVISWNAMLTAYAQNGHHEDGVQLFYMMDVHPDSVTFVLALGMCSNLNDLKQIHSKSIDAGMGGEVEVQNAIITTYAKCGSLPDAREIFEKMQTKDMVSWNAMLASYAQNGYGKEVLNLHMRMQLEGWKSDAFTLCSVFGACSTLGSLSYGQELLDKVGATKEEDRAIVETAAFKMYAKCGSLDEARRIFDGMYSRDTVSWSAMIASYVQYTQPAQALELYHKMCLEGLDPDGYTYSSVLAACAELRALQQGKKIHSRVVFEGLDSGVVIGTALVDLYAKCGDMELARSVFNRMGKCRNSVTWNALLAGYLFQGKDKQVIELYHELEESSVEISESAFASVLSSYTNLSLETEARALHSWLVTKGLDTNNVVGTTLIDMQARFGSLEDARKAFDMVKMKDSVCWNAMLAAYARLGHYTEASRHLQEGCLEGVLVPTGLTLTSLLNSCSHSGLLEQGRDIFMLLILDFGVLPNAENFHCIADLLARSGRISEAEDVIEGMPFQPEAFSWNTLLSACTVHSDSTRGERAAREIIKINTSDKPQASSAAYVLLSNLCRDDQRI